MQKMLKKRVSKTGLVISKTPESGKNQDITRSWDFRNVWDNFSSLIQIYKMLVTETRDMETKILQMPKKFDFPPFCDSIFFLKNQPLSLL